MQEISLTQIQGSVREVEAEFLGHKFGFSYKPAAFTPELESKLFTRTETPEQEASQLEAFTQFLTEWGVKDKPSDKKAMPITVETLKKLPSRMLTAIVTATVEDLTPGKPTTTGSFGR